MSHRHDSTSFVPPVPYGDIPYIEQGQPRANVVIASNQASDWRMVILAGVFLTLMTFTIWIVAHYAFRIPQGWAGVLALLVFAACGRFALIIVNGDWVAHREISATERSERKRIDAQSDAIAGHYEYLTLAETNRHEEEKARIEAQTTNRAVQEQLAWQGDTIHAMQRKLLAQDTIAPPSATYVQAKAEPARAAVDAWIDTLWHADGSPAFVKGQTPMPWTSLWRGEPWCDAAREIVLSSGIVVPNKAKTYFPIVVNDKRAARLMLRAYLGR